MITEDSLQAVGPILEAGASPFGKSYGISGSSTTLLHLAVEGKRQHVAFVKVSTQPPLDLLLWPFSVTYITHSNETYVKHEELRVLLPNSLRCYHSEDLCSDNKCVEEGACLRLSSIHSYESMCLGLLINTKIQYCT